MKQILVIAFLWLSRVTLCNLLLPISCFTSEYAWKICQESVFLLGYQKKEWYVWHVATLLSWSCWDAESSAGELSVQWPYRSAGLWDVMNTTILSFTAGRSVLGGSGLGLVVFLTNTSHSSKPCSGVSPGAFAYRHFPACFFHASLSIPVTKLYIFTLHWLPLPFHEQNLQVTVLSRIFWNINFK